MSVIKRIPQAVRNLAALPRKIKLFKRGKKSSA